MEVQTQCSPMTKPINPTTANTNMALNIEDNLLQSGVKKVKEKKKHAMRFPRK